MAKLTIDGQQCEFPDGTVLFEACRQVRGEALPHFCYHPDLSIAGVCRLCQVEIEGMPKLTIACNTTVKEGMVVHTRSEKVVRAAQQILEMHLINHPVDCPICDQAGECGLQDQYMLYGLYESSVGIPDKVNKRKAKVIGPQVILDQERCVLCSRCVRFCNEITHTGELGIFNRGDRAEIDVAPGVQLDNNYSLNTVDICPVGALTSRDFRFQRRVWMLKSADGICPGCATGCNVRIDHAAGRIYRLKPRRNPAVNGAWMCDLGRMTYKAVHGPDRLAGPRRAGAPCAWADLQPGLADLLGPGRIGLVIASAHQTLEELFLLRRLAGGEGGEDFQDAQAAQVARTAVVAGPAGADAAAGDDLLLDGDRAPNRRGLAVVGIPELGAADLAARIGRAEGTILIHGGDPARDPLVSAALAGKGRVLYLGTHDNQTARAADVILAGAAWAEKAGIFVNRQGRWQGFPQAVARPAGAREDWRVLAEAAALLPRGPQAPASPPAALGSLRAVRAALAAAAGCAGIDLNALPEGGFVPGGANR